MEELLPMQGMGPSVERGANSMARMPTLQHRIELAVKQAEERLAAVKKARELLDRNPDLEELLNIMQRNHF